MRKLLTAMLAALAAAATQQANAQGEVGTPTAAWECLLTWASNADWICLPLDDEARLMEELDDVEKTYNLYNAQCREVIYSEYGEDRVDEALALANECADELEEFKADLSKSYDGHSCMGMIYWAGDLCESNKDASGSKALALIAEVRRHFHVYNTRCVWRGEPGLNFWGKKGG